MISNFSFLSVWKMKQASPNLFSFFDIPMEQHVFMSHRFWERSLGIGVGSLSLYHLTYFTVTLSQLVLLRKVLRKRETTAQSQSTHLQSLTVLSPSQNWKIPKSPGLRRKKEKGERILSHFEDLSLLDLFASA